jgi:hypothetical protein
LQRGSRKACGRADFARAIVSYRPGPK